MTVYTYELIGSNGDHLYFDNVSFSVKKEGLQGFSGHPGEADLITSPGQIGALLNSVTLGKRYVSIPITIIGTNRANLETKRNRLVQAINPINGLCTWVWNKEDGSRMLLQVLADADSPSFTSGTTADATQWNCVVDFVAPDPCWYTDTEVTNLLRGFVGGFSLPFTLPLTLGGVGTTLEFTNPGDTPSPCQIELRGMLQNPVITNLITGKKITVRKTIQDGEILTIDTTFGNRSVILTDADGNETNALHYCTIGSSFFQIPSGDVSVDYTATSEGSGALGYLTYTPRWLSQ